MPPIPTVRPNGPAIRTFRKIRELSINQCAADAGVALSALHYYETEKKSPTLGVLEKVAAALDVPVQAICKDDIPVAAAQRGAA
jgi:transcriptional regulator with XRE-family HTH domain